jgi:hypothetical protein
MKVARTLADLEADEAETTIGTAHVAEAIWYRNCGAMRGNRGLPDQALRRQFVDPGKDQRKN